MVVSVYFQALSITQSAYKGKPDIMSTVTVLEGRRLTPEILSALACGGSVSISAGGRARMLAARALIDAAVQEKRPVYGVTTGLGSNVDKVLSADELATFSVQTLRGRAQALGAPLPCRVVRAAMVVRLNTLLSGAAGASLAVAGVLRDCIGAGITPVVGESASIGASDLVWGATMGVALMGEGRMHDAAGLPGDAFEVLRAAGIAPLQPGPRDGLALASHASFSAALAALGVADAQRALSAAQSAAALSMQGFVANTSPLHPDVLALCERPGEAQAVAGLRALLAGAAIEQMENARRLQDPLSIRNLAQIHGAAFAALAYAREAAQADINGASDNPVVLLEQGEIVSGGAYHTTHLTIAVDTLSRALAHLVTAQLARIGKMLATRFTGLPQYLVAPGCAGNGFAPLLKPAEALAVEIAHLATPAPVWPSISADGVEDVMSSTPLAAKSLLAIIEKWRRLTAIEMVVAVQAIELRGQVQLGPALTVLRDRVREIVPVLQGDRSLIAEIEVLAGGIGEGRFSM